MAIQVVAVDIDGTVTDYERLFIWKGVEALRHVERRGIPVIVATGNVAPVSKAFSSFIGLSGPIVAENGGVVLSNDGRRTTILASRKRPDQAVRLLRRKGFDVRPIWSDRYRISEVALELNLDEARVREALQGWGLDLVGTRFALHIMERGLDKFKGLKTALAFLEKPVSPRDVLAIGDSNNDVTMFRGCGHSGCVNNGSEKAKAAAEFVAKKRFGAGVAEILRHFRVIPKA